MIRIKNPADLRIEVESHQKTIIFSRRKTELVSAFRNLICIANAECVDLDLDNKAWSNVDFVFEYVRCFFPTRFFQIAKEIHYGTKQWVYLQPLYRELFHVVFADISADTGIMSNGTMESVKCSPRMQMEFLERADRELEKVLDQRHKQAKDIAKKRCAIIEAIDSSPANEENGSSRKTS